MPSPLDIPSIKGVDLDGNEIERHSSDEEPFAALAFKDVYKSQHLVLKGYPKPYGSDP